MIVSIAWLMLVFGAYAAGRLRGLREALEIIMEEQNTATGPESYFDLPIRVAKRIVEKTRRWAPWALWR